MPAFPSLLRPSTLAAVAGGALAFLWLLGALESFDLPVSDVLLLLPQPGRAAEVPVSAVLIDDRAIEEHGALPWPRPLLARLVERVQDLGARAVALDLILAEPGTESGDQTLEEALARGPVCLAAALSPDGGWILPLDRFGGARRAAHAEAEIGPDGVVRSILATKQRGEIALPALSLAAARMLRPEIAVAPGTVLRPDFRLPPDRVSRVSAADLLGGPYAGAFDGRLVFIGIAAPGGTDQFVVPTRRSRPSPGVLTHAAATVAVLRGGLVRPLPAAGVAAACLLLAALAQLLRSRAGSLRVTRMLAVLGGLIAVSVAVLWTWGLQVPVITLGAAFGLSALLREAIESGSARRETGELLGRLVRELSEGDQVPEPRGAAGRLHLARELQTRLIRDRDLRRALLDALEDGVVRWDEEGGPLLANQAAVGLWGEPPHLKELPPAGADTLRRAGKELRISVRKLEDGQHLHGGAARDRRRDDVMTRRARVLVAEDDVAWREMMSLALRKEGYEVTAAEGAAALARLLAERSYDLVVSDIYLGDGTAIDLLGPLKRSHPEAAVILITAQGSVETVAAARDAGVFDYLAKPFALETLVARVEAALGRQASPAAEVAAGPESMIVGSDPAIVEVYKAVARVAPLAVPVLIRGETGTGKELVARALHRFGAAPQGPWIGVNCGAIPESLVESELFGHRRGAFTGAIRDHQGSIESARGGTLLLDEIGELSPLVQVKLLRFLQDGEIRPVGAEQGIRVAVRVVAATHRDLAREVAEGRFREDFYYRLAAYEIVLPPLRERRGDIPALAEHFRRHYAERFGLAAAAPTEETLGLLGRHPWPGNVRQLENVVQRALVDLGGLADAEGLRALLGEPQARAREEMPRIGGDLTLEELERLHLEAVLKRVGGNRSRAAEILGIERKSLYRKARRLDIPLNTKKTDREDAP